MRLRTSSEAYWAGPPPRDTTPQPCIACGQLTSCCTIVGAKITTSKRGFTFEVEYRCPGCAWRHYITRVEQRLADPTLHPEARPRVEAALVYAREQLEASDGAQAEVPEDPVRRP